MDTKHPPILSLRHAVVMLMTVLMLAFTSAEVRANVMTRMAEEAGTGRFYEDKVHRVHVEVVRMRAMQTSRDPEALSLLNDATPHVAAPPHFSTRSRATATPRAPPHQPRAPPVTA
jgi:hypothetical protein